MTIIIYMKAANIGQVTPYHDTRAQPTVAMIALGELSVTLGHVQQQPNQNNTPPLWRESPFVQELQTWLYNLPNELSFPVTPGLERWDLVLMENVFSKASDARKIELVNILFRTSS